MLVIGILATIAVPGYGKVKENAMKRTVVSGAQAIGRAADAAARSRISIGMNGDTNDGDIEQALAEANLAGVATVPGPYQWDAASNTLKYTSGPRCFQVTILIDQDGNGSADSTGNLPGPADSYLDKTVVSDAVACP